MKWRWWRTAEEMAADFAAVRCAETDAKFIADCGLPDAPFARRVALAVRRSVASYGMIESDFIQATDTYPDQLIELSGWDSLDFYGWILELERELDQTIPSESFQNIRHPFNVAHLAHATYVIVKQHADRNAIQP